MFSNKCSYKKDLLTKSDGIQKWTKYAKIDRTMGQKKINKMDKKEFTIPCQHVSREQIIPTFFT